MLKIAHRGASGYEPENTLRSFKKAIKLKVDMIELDVWLSKDNVPVAIHDQTINRTTNSKGKVKNLTLKELKQLDAGKGERIPTLEEVIDLVKGKCKLNFEIKDPESIGAVCDLIKRKNFAKDSLISSASKDVLMIAKEKVPLAERGLLLCQSKTKFDTFWCVFWRKLTLPFVKNKFVGFAKSVDVKVICINRFNATKRNIIFFKKNGFQVYVWTVDSRKEIGRLKLLEVDGVFSNFPDKIP